MVPVDWNALIRHIDRSLPGRGLWMQCVPVFDDAAGAGTEEGVGLAIQREGGALGRWYAVVFFRVVPDESASDQGGDFLPGRGDDASDWVVEVGYEGDHDTLAEAIAEAKGLARDLPTGGVYATHEIREKILDQVTDPEDLEESA